MDVFFRNAGRRTTFVRLPLMVAAALAIIAAPVAAAPVRHTSRSLPASAPDAKPALPPLPPAQLNATIAAALSDHAGQRRAGLLCMPNGGLKVRDFASSDIAFKTIVDQALQDMKPKSAALVADGTMLTISLGAIKAKLCARSWGAFGKGDRVSLTGTAIVSFDWSVVRPSHEHHATAEIALDVAHADAAAPEEILRQAVDRLLEVILASAA